jgi:hypothetical protein
MLLIPYKKESMSAFKKHKKSVKKSVKKSKKSKKL